jgi:hypothetical protein
MDTTIDKNNMPVAYSPNEFFYQAVDNQMTPDKCSHLDKTAFEEYGSTYQIDNGDELWSKLCTQSNMEKDPNPPDVMTKCYQHELCMNKNYTSVLTDTNVDHSGSDKRHIDTTDLYNLEYLTLGNMSFGVIKLTIVILLIYYHK